MVERIEVLRLAMKYLNLWIRQLEMKRKEIGELAGLLKVDEVKKGLMKKRTLRNGQEDAHTTSPRKQRECCLRKSTTFFGMMVEKWHDGANGTKFTMKSQKVKLKKSGKGRPRHP